MDDIKVYIEEITSDDDSSFNDNLTDEENSRSWIRSLLPILISIIAVVLVMTLTILMLYWNFYEQKQEENGPRKSSIILDHWGKISPRKMFPLQSENCDRSW